MNEISHNDNTPSPALGIPGRRNGVITRFFDCNEQQLSAMASDLSLAMGKEGLARCQVYFSKNKSELRFPTLYEIDFLDAIVRRHTEMPEAIRIGRTNEGHTQLSATREDFLQKLKVLCPRLAQSISLSEAAEVASRYLDAIGVGRERDAAPASGGPLAATEALPANVAFLLLQPRDENVFYEDAIKKSLDNPAIATKLLRHGRISSEGIAVTLAKETQGIRINLAMLGSSDPFCLLSDHIGAYWVAVHRDAVVPLRFFFAEYGLNTVFFAITTNSGILTPEPGEYPPLFLDLKLIDEFASFGKPMDFQLSMSDDRDAPFFESMYDASIHAMLGCAGGESRTELSPTVRYCFPRLHPSEAACGRNLETVLGIYRAWIELCVSDHATVCFSERVSTPAWTITLPQSRVAPARTQEDSQVFLIPLSVDGNGMPDFSTCRTLCDTLARLSIDGKILACREAGKETLAAAEDSSIVRALLVESSEPLPFPLATRVSGECFWETTQKESAASE